MSLDVFDLDDVEERLGRFDDFEDASDRGGPPSERPERLDDFKDASPPSNKQKRLDDPKDTPPSPKKQKQHVVEDPSPLSKDQKQHDIDIPRGPARRKSDLRGERCGISGSCVRRLMACKWPIVLFNLLCFCNLAHRSASNGPSCSRNFKCVEYFSGVGNVARAFDSRNLRSRTYDVIDDPREDLNTPEGLLMALFLACCLMPGGLAHWATVCSSWVFMSRSSTGRDKDTFGNGSITCQEANMQVSRMIAIVMLLECLGVHWILEQPMTSVMLDLELWQLIPRHAYLAKTFTWMGAFGAGTRKPTFLLSTSPWARSLKRTLPRSWQGAQQHEPTATTSISGLDNRRGVTGGPGLKRTQAYPIMYGVEVLRSWEGSTPFDLDDVSSISDSEYEYLSDLCEHAKFEDAATFLGVATDVWSC